MADFVVRDTDSTWRRLTDAQPPDQQPVIVHIRVAGTLSMPVTFEWNTTSWVTPLGGRFAALPADEWRPEDER